MKAESENINGIYQKAENNWSRLLIRLVAPKLVRLTNISYVGKEKKKKKPQLVTIFVSGKMCGFMCVHIHLHTCHPGST